jgi:sulfonate transport system substrate-binding protein
MKPRVASIAFVAALVCAASALAQPVTIRFGFAEVSPGNRPFTNSGPVSMAHTMGYLEEEFRNDPNVKIQFSFFNGGAVVNEAVANNQIDISNQGDLPWIIGRSNGLKTKIIFGSDTRQNVYLAVTPKSGVEKFADLAGKKVSVFRGTNLHLATSKALEAHGLKERDLKLINMDYGTANAALATGDVDANFGQAEMLEMQRKGIVKVIWDTKAEPRFTRAAHVIVTESFEKAHPELVQRVVNAVVKAAKWSSEESNREAVMEALAKTGRPIQGYRDDFAGQTMNFRMSPLIDPWMISAYRKSAIQAKELGLVRTDVNTDDGFEPKYLDKAIKDQGLDGYWTRYDADSKPLAR